MTNVLIAIVSNKYDYIEENHMAISTRLKLKLIIEAIGIWDYYLKINRICCRKNSNRKDVSEKPYFYYMIKQKSEYSEGLDDHDTDLNFKTIYYEITNLNKAMSKVRQEEIDEPIGILKEKVNKIRNSLGKLKNFGLFFQKEIGKTQRAKLETDIQD